MMKHLTTASPQILMIGYGNTLRSDDGVGYHVAETVASWHLPQVRSRSVHQLLPELAAEFVDVDVVLFVDAIAQTTPSQIQCQPVQPDPTALLRPHQITPASLLALAQQLYQAQPEAYLLTIPAVNFAIGTTLSAIAQQGYTNALRFLRNTSFLQMRSTTTDSVQCLDLG